MKLSIILLLVSCLRVSANSYSQKLNLTLKNASYSQAFSAIEQKTRFRILYSDDLLPENTVTVEARNEPLTNVLNHILYGSNLTYKVLENKVIVISRTDTKFQAKTVSGTVTDTSGSPLSGVSVLIKGTTKGTITNAQGVYSIDVPDNNVRLVFAYVGYATQEIAANTSTINVSLVPLEATAGTDIVVTALGIKSSQRGLSYNVQQIGGDQVNTVKDASFVNALSGKVAGLTLTSAPGPGAPTKVVLRGNKSIAGNNNALYVIDGIPMLNPATATSDGFQIKENPDFISNINPDDIESINVLTGASGAALYGMQGANGVIIINTKKGNADKTQVSFSSQAQYDNPFILPKRQTQYGSTVTNGAPNFDGWGDKVSSGFDPSDFFNTGSTYTNAISISGGNEKSQSFLSAAATNAKGVLPNNTLSRYNISYRNTTLYFDKKLSIGFAASYTYQKFQNMPSAGQYFNPLPAVYLFSNGLDFNAIKNNYETFDSTNKIYRQNWPYGDHSLTLQNPYWVMYRDILATTRNRIMGSVTAKYNFTDWLNLQGRVSIDRTNDVNENQMYATTNTYLTSNSTNGGYSIADPSYSQTYADLLLNMNKNLGNKFSLNATLGTSLTNQLTTNLGIAGGISPYLVPDFFFIRNLDNTSLNLTQQKDRVQTQSVFFSGELGYHDYLYLTVTARNDWPSTLAYATKSSFFYPSIGLSAVISQMTKLPDFISYAKVRASYAGVGNALPIYKTNPTVDLGTGGSLNPISDRPFTTLAPEHTNSVEGGLDLRFAHDKINFSATYYHTNTTNQFFTAPAPLTSGYANFYYNAGNVQNQGLELSLGYNGRWGDFTWNPSANFSLNRSKVLKMLTYKDASGNTVEVDSINLGGDPNILVKKGLPFGVFSLYDFKRDAQGNIIKDDNGLPEYADNSSIDKQLSPSYMFGITNSFGYKNFNLSFLIDARVGGYVYSKTQQYYDQYGLSVNSAKNRTDDSQAYYQNLASKDGAAYVYSATNIRLRELSFGYTIPGKAFNNKIQKLQLSFIARNLWMIKNNAPFDPDMTMLTGNSYQGTDYFAAPTLRSFGVSLNVVF